MGFVMTFSHMGTMYFRHTPTPHSLTHSSCLLLPPSAPFSKEFLFYLIQYMTENTQCLSF